MQCPLLENTNENELLKRLQFKDKIIAEQREIIKGLMDENKTYRKEYWRYREQQDKDDWGI